MKIGDGWKREIVAYRIFKDHFDYIPQTVPVRLPLGNDPSLQPELGSCQRYVADAETYISYSERRKVNPLVHLPPLQIQQTALVDILLGSQDREHSNILIKDDRLVLIDNGDSLGESLLRHDTPPSSFFNSALGFHAGVAEESLVTFIDQMDIESLIHQIQTDSLISNKQAYELRFRYCLIQYLIHTFPTIPISEIAAAFAEKQRGKPALLAESIANKAWKIVNSESTAAMGEEELLGRFLSISRDLIQKTILVKGEPRLDI